jgi:hypothetical protein
MKKLTDKENISNLILIASYQGPIIRYMLSSTDKFHTSDLYDFNKNKDNIYNMIPINTNPNFTSLLKFFLSKNNIFKEKFTKSLDELKNYSFDDNLKKFLLSKTFNGIPLLLQELLNKLIDMDLIKNKENKYILTYKDELNNMIKFKDFSKLDLPYRIEKLMGNIIDSIKNQGEIIILKAASVIGNIFDIDTLYKINPIRNKMNEDVLKMIYYYESINILEILHDLEPENLVAKFSLPFFREVLYSRMLSEQKTPIHSEIAKNFKNMKISYMSSNFEIDVLLRHLIASEKTVMNIMEERKEEESKKNNKKEKSKLNKKK